MKLTPRASRSPPAGFDMTPMIDVVFLLIIFFLYTAQITQLSRSPVDLPEERGDDPEGSRPAEITIDIDASGTYLIESSTVSLSEIATLVVEQSDSLGSPEQVRVLIRPDKSLPSTFVNAVVLELADAGIRSWRLGSLSPREGG